jgi:saccharopine dehydrogenase (NADP+, L-glutamate forming)
MSKAFPYHVMDGYNFIAYPNRDSVQFREFYNIPEAHTVIRGSLRYDGNPAFVKALIELGWIDTTQKNWLTDGMTWAEIWQKLIESESTNER